MHYKNKDAIKAAHLIFPEISNVKKINKGYSHDIFEVFPKNNEKTFIIRFSNGNKEENSLEKEIRVNEILAENNLPVPKIILYQKASNELPLEFAIMSKIEGHDLDDLWKKLLKGEQEKIAEKMGELLGKIHNIKFDKFGVLTPNGIREKYDFNFKKVGKEVKINRHSAEILSRAFSDLGFFSSHKFVTEDLVSKIVKYLIKNRRLTEIKEKPSLIHGDFDIRNIKVIKEKDQWTISGIFDFEYTSSLMREYDFIKLNRIGFLSKGHIRNSLLKGYNKYQKIDKDFDKRIEFFRFMRDIGFAVFLLKAGNKQLANKTIERIKSII